MVQELQKLIRMGKKEEAQDLYFHSSEGGVPGFMRVGDEALCAVPSLLRR